MEDIKNLKVQPKIRKRSIPKHPKSHYQAITIIILILILIAVTLFYIIFFIFQYNPFEGFSFIPKDPASNSNLSSSSLNSITGTSAKI